MSPAKTTSLKSGFTTGAAAAVATKAALSLLLSDKAPDCVDIRLLTGDTIRIPIHRCRLLAEDRAEALVIKNAGDDPDVTHLAEIGARVSLRPDSSDGSVHVTAGEGVGRVTKPGLEIPPGEPAINPGPLRMIREAVEAVRATYGVSTGVTVEIFVPKGEELAKKTLNHRLGILGGISILGTTGLVKPLSHDAYIATIRSALSVARAGGLDHAVLTTGRRSEKHVQRLMPELPEEAFVQIGDFFQKSLAMAADMDFRGVTLAIFFGKAVKMAQGIPHTHAAKSAMVLDRLSDWALRVTGDASLAEAIRDANTARHAFDYIHPASPALIAEVVRRVAASAKAFAPSLDVRCILFDFDGQPIFDSEHNDKAEATQ